MSITKEQIEHALKFAELDRSTEREFNAGYDGRFISYTEPDFNEVIFQRYRDGTWAAWCGGGYTFD